VARVGAGPARRPGLYAPAGARRPVKGRPTGLLACAVLLAVATLACGRPPADTTRVIVLGFDGMDYALTRELMAEGRMPNFSRLAAEGSFAPLGTSVPPQSPVAWSNFITGRDPGAHGIFDFVHRDPETRMPYLSTSRAVPPSRVLRIGRYQVPLSAGRVELLRHGRPFWEDLEARGVKTAIVRMPANFPPSGTAHRELSGMGTPDLAGTYGTFTFYSSELFAFGGRPLAGGRLQRVHVRDHVVRSTLRGPDNPFLAEPTPLETAFVAFLDPREPAIKLVVGAEERVLQAGEWSDWVPIAFPMIPTQSLGGMARFYLKQVRPEFELYMTPLNIDPLDPALPISTPASYAAELASATGRFYTQGMPEDTKALEEGVLTRDEFLAQARLAGDEVRRQLHHALDTFDSGLLFYYVGNVDQVSHMLWGAMDPDHPAHDPVADAPYRDVIRDLYVELDEMVGETLARMGADTTLIVMSDHGFTSWRRAFHLNSWLRENGYLALANPYRMDDPGYFGNVAWSRTRAYGVGLNGLYLNLQGREAGGIVTEAERDALLDEIRTRLLAFIDPASDQPAITKVYRADETFAAADHPELMPDLLVGYARGTRCSNESALGGIPQEIISDNTGLWTGDHCMDHEAVPGILLTNRRLRQPAPTLERLSAAIVAEFERR
jgi:predicted AlkP superfamily phosphohydrolase/phosphomutase